MNRLIIIGNGFDLAHSMKTSYCDFITDYISRAINSFFENRKYEDPLIKIEYKYVNQSLSNYEISTPETAIKDLKKYSGHPLITINISSVFLLETIEKVTEMNWVDLENEYFEQLLKTKYPPSFNFIEVKKLNKEFGFLKTKLEQYLSRVEKMNSKLYTDRITRIFCEDFRQNEIVLSNITNSQPKKILILNFNYTNTLEEYRNNCPKEIPTTINYIHGQLGSKTNPIIFGFGDEYDKRYLEFEDLKNNDLLHHIKSFGYFKATNYHNLTRFTDDDEFQVYVFGHSLGLTDRTMLKQIFEHIGCKSIKIFYYKRSDEENDYTEKTMEISRHFTDKGIMRKKIVPYNLSEPMPQLKS